MARPIRLEFSNGLYHVMSRATYLKSGLAFCCASQILIGKRQDFSPFCLNVAIHNILQTYSYASGSMLARSRCNPCKMIAEFRA